MVAHTATTSASRATGCLSASAPNSPSSSTPRATDPFRVSASPPSAPLPLSPSAPSLPSPSALLPLGPSAPSLSSPSDSWRSSTSLSSLLPPPTLTDEILDDLAVPQFSLATVAQKHGLTLSGMLTWLNLPETREVLALRESAAYAHARHVAALNIGHAVETVASIVRDYKTTRPEREAQDRKTPGSAHRAATNARKAAWLLLQFARIVPVNEADLRRATGCLSASAKNTTSTPSRAHRTASVNQRTSSSDSSRVACLLEEQACSESVRSTRDCAATRPTSPHGSSATGPLRVSAPPESLPSRRVPSVNERISPNSHSRATGCLPASAKNTSHGPVLVSDSSLPSPTLHAAGALHDLPPASALKDDADSPLASSPQDAANSSLPSAPLTLSPSVPAPSPPRSFASSVFDRSPIPRSSDTSETSAFSSPSKPLPRARDPA
jgi:hypothetical protein